jgi:hypothetical protein
MRRLLWAGVILPILGGCAMLLNESTPPKVRHVIVPTTLDATYARAQRAATRMGAMMLREEPQQHTFLAQLHNVIGLHVSINRVEEGTQMTVTGSVLPHKSALGILTEVDDFLVAYWKE